MARTIFSTMRFIWYALAVIVASTMPVWTPAPRANDDSAIVSLGKHDPPYPGPACKNLPPMRRSMPMALATVFTSAPSTSQRLAISLMKEIFVAKKAFEAYLMSSAVSSVVTTMGVSSRNSGSWILRRMAAARLLSAPITTRSGRMKVSIAEPSRRNSGLDATSNSAPRRAKRRMWSARARAVPTGAVLFCTTSL